MEQVQLGKSELLSPRIVYGCMRLVGDNSVASRAKGKRAIHAAIEAGYNHFDHADIYGGGECEALFGEVLRDSPALRDQLVLTSKCGIRKAGQPHAGDPGRYDFSKNYMITTMEGSLRRLGVECLDLLLLHRPDYLFQPQEVAEAFQILHDSGKVRHFGVSNFKPSQVTLLQAACPFPLLVNQVEINIHRIEALEDGTLDQCQQLGITPQSWCPLGGVVYPAWGNTFSAQDEARIQAEFARQALHYETENWIVMLAWLLRHPANILPVIGTTTPERIHAAKQALALNYSREDWYRLLEARNGRPVP